MICSKFHKVPELCDGGELLNIDLDSVRNQASELVQLGFLRVDWRYLTDPVLFECGVLPEGALELWQAPSLEPECTHLSTCRGCTYCWRRDWNWAQLRVLRLMPVQHDQDLVLHLVVGDLLSSICIHHLLGNVSIESSYLQSHLTGLLNDTAGWHQQALCQHQLLSRWQLLNVQLLQKLR